MKRDERETARRVDEVLDRWEKKYPADGPTVPGGLPVRTPGKTWPPPGDIGPWPRMEPAPTDNAWLFPEPRKIRRRSVFWPVFWAVLAALVVFTVLAGAGAIILLDQAVKP